MASCTNCGAPLVSTMVFPYKEFVRVACGNKMGFVEPRPTEETPAMREVYEDLQREWDVAVDAARHEVAEDPSCFLTSVVSGWLRGRAD